MKLYEVNYLNDCEFESTLKVGISAKQVYEDFCVWASENFSCFMNCDVKEINNIDGYSITLTKKKLNKIKDPEIYPTLELKTKWREENEKEREEWLKGYKR